MVIPKPHERDARAYIETSPIPLSGLILLQDAAGSRQSIMIPFRLYLFILVGIAVVGLAYFLLRRKPKTADDLERERRAWLDRIGRITDGTVIDVQEMPGARERPPHSSSTSTTSPECPTKPRRM